MRNIELPDEKYEGIEKVAESLGISITELITRAVKACTSVLDLFPSISGEAISEEPAEELRASITIGGKLYKNATWIGLLQVVLADLGYKKVFETYPEDKRNIISLERPEAKGAKARRVLEVADGKYKFYVNTNLSSRSIIDYLNTVAGSLNLSFEKPDEVQE